MGVGCDAHLRSLNPAMGLREMPMSRCPPTTAPWSSASGELYLYNEIPEWLASSLRWALVSWWGPIHSRGLLGGSRRTERSTISMIEYSYLQKPLTMYPFPARCPEPRISHSKTGAEPRTQALFRDICSVVKPSSILEIGSWMGSSAIAWARASSEFQPDSAVYCVDTWLGSVEHYLSTCGNSWNIEKLSLSDYGPTFFDDFLWNIWDSGYQDKILPFRASSSSALPFFEKEGLSFDVVYVDGAHNMLSVFSDVKGALKIVSQKGLICGDDFDWLSVRRGLLCSALTHRRPLAFYAKGKDFVVLDASNADYKQSLIQLGYARWRATNEIMKFPSSSKRLLVERFR